MPDVIVDTDMLASNAVSSAKLQNTAIASGDLPAGSVLQMVMVETSATSAPSSETTILTNTITTKVSSTDSDIFVIGSLAHGLGPKDTNLDPYGLILRLKEDGSNMAMHRSDVFAGSGGGVNYGPEWDVRTTQICDKSGATWSAGDSISYTMTAGPDGNNAYSLINRTNESSSSFGTSYLLVMEVAK